MRPLRKYTTCVEEFFRFLCLGVVKKILLQMRTDKINKISHLIVILKKKSTTIVEVYNLELLLYLNKQLLSDNLTAHGIDCHVFEKLTWKKGAQQMQRYTNKRPL